MTGRKGTFSNGMKKTERIMVAFLLVAVAIVFALTATSVDSTDPPYSHNISYVDPAGNNTAASIPYSGIASTEYNPVYWNNTGNNDGIAGNWITPASSWNYELGANGVISTITEGTPTKSYVVTTSNTGTQIIDSPSNSYSVNIQNWPVTLEFKTTTNNKTYNFQIPHTTISNKSANMSLDSEGDIYDTYKFTGNGNTVTVSVTINNYSLNPNKVFGGWLTFKDGKWITVYPGDVVDNSTSTLYAKWIEPDVFILKNDSVYVDHWTEGYRYVFDILSPYAKPSNIVGGNNIAAIDMDNYKGRYDAVIRGDSRTASDMFGTIFMLSIENTKDWKNDFQMAIGQVGDSHLKTLPTGTYRSADLGNPVLLRFGGKVADDNLCRLGGNVIIDNVGIKGHRMRVNTVIPVQDPYSQMDMC